LPLSRTLCLSRFASLWRKLSSFLRKYLGAVQMLHVETGDLFGNFTYTLYVERTSTCNIYREG
jgi:hypothetical protein